MYKKFTVFFIVCIFLMGCTDSGSTKKTLSEIYPEPWKDDFNVGITRALAKNKVSGCGQYKYRTSLKSEREHLVRCSHDGINWSTYIVWVGIDEVMGPYEPDPTMD